MVAFKTRTWLLGDCYLEFSMSTLVTWRRDRAVPSLIGHQQDHSIVPVWLVERSLYDESVKNEASCRGHICTVDEPMVMSMHPYIFETRYVTYRVQSSTWTYLIELCCGIAEFRCRVLVSVERSCVEQIALIIGFHRNFSRNYCDLTARPRRKRSVCSFMGIGDQ